MCLLLFLFEHVCVFLCVCVCVYECVFVRVSVCDYVFLSLYFLLLFCYDSWFMSDEMYLCMVSTHVCVHGHIA